MSREDDSVDATLPVGASRGPTGDDTTQIQQLPMLLAAYEIGELLGRGGMGEVVQARDRRIGREVALKRMRDADPTDDAVARFLREAQIQARLDHPSIVPVHELGQDGEGRPYFTMKRLAGVTLAQRLEGGGAMQPLLRVFSEVCRAIDLAHSKGVIHRDLKPANIMLGEYGEVYVLDWGLARVLAEHPDSPAAVEGPASGPRDTQLGDVLGTPGYMAPEQLRNALTVERPADVYSLGSILFEILAGEPLHPRGAAALATTLHPGDCSPARRRPDRVVPPELDSLCTAAVAHEPGARPNVHEVALRIQAYLDGDRDLERRRALAAEELAHAYAALAENRRDDAMQAAGRALALDPRAGAAELVSRLMLEPAGDPPPQLRAALRAADADAVRRHARSSCIGLSSFALMVPVVAWNGVHDWALIGAIVGLSLVLAAITFGFMLRPNLKSSTMLAYLALVSLMLPLIERLCGPLILVPALTGLITWAALMYPALTRHPLPVLTLLLLGWLAPPVLEHVGLLASTWSITDGVIASRSAALVLDGPRSIVCVFGASVATILVAAYHGTTLSRANRDAQRRLVTQAWHLQQLLPPDARMAAARD